MVIFISLNIRVLYNAIVTVERPNYNPYLYNETEQYDQGQEDRRWQLNHRPGQPNQLDHPDWWYDTQKVVSRVFNFVS